MLEKARTYERRYAPEISPADRPLFHLSTYVGWMNDPNGFSRYRGEYHLFYQYYPYETKWGPMHWGHAKSSDLLHWEFLPCALAPDADYDNAGCFSGSAIELPDGRQLLLYTGVRSVLDGEGRPVITQAQCIAVGDGVDYEKLPNNPVICTASLPEGASTEHFRDPRIWKTENGYRMVAGSLTDDGSGSVVLYSSSDAFQWKFERVIERCRNRYGKMWECPDYFPLDGRQILMASPQSMLADGGEFHNGNGSLFLVGQEDAEEQFTWDKAQAIDFGLDFYAPQTLVTDDGRRVLIGWMQSWESCSQKPDHWKWFGQMTLPRELYIRNGRVCQKPIRELEAMRQERAQWSGTVTGCVMPETLRGRQLDLLLQLSPENTEEPVTVELASNGRFHTDLIFDPVKHQLRIDRTLCGYPFDILNIREFAVSDDNGALALRVVMDTFSFEVFVGNGEQTAASTLHAPRDCESIAFRTKGTWNVQAEAYTLR